MTTVHLIEGPVGAGKSTYARALAGQTQGIHIALDAWFTRLFSPDRPASDVMAWYGARKERLIQLIWSHSQNILAAGKEPILELGLIQRQGRMAFCRQVQAAGFTPIMHVLDAPEAVRRARVRRRNEEQGDTFSMVVPDAVFDMASAMWEAPDDAERRECEIDFARWMDNAA